ncbi:MAG: serine/threonine protein kinase [Planctomycetales bacterium]|nr:serine/threonine protein kinase [Planctomycetales bacterium]
MGGLLQSIWAAWRMVIRSKWAKRAIVDAESRLKTGTSEKILSEQLPPELAEHREYQIVKMLGRGGMGVVYLAKHIPMDRLEVLKVLNERLLGHQGAKQRFQNEIRAAAKLNHPNIVTSYNVMSLGEILVFAMEFVHGMDLHKFIQKHGTLPIPLACSFARQLAAGLQHAHEKGLVHRDIKPSNVIVFKDGNALKLKILDFGLAKATSEKAGGGLTQDGMMLGTPEYMSPEQTLDAAKADIRADIYSLGCTLYHMLLGHSPYQGTQGQILIAHAQQEPKSISLQRPEVPAELEAVVLKMMAKDKERRFQTPSQVYQALKPFLGPARLSKGSGEVVAEINTVNDLKSPQRDTSVEESTASVLAAQASLVEAELSITPEHSIATDHNPQRQIATMMADRRLGKSRRNKHAKTKPTLARRRTLLIGITGLFVVGVAFLGTLIIHTPKGTIIVENLPADAEVSIDGERVNLARNVGKDKATISREPGKYEIRAETNSGVTVVGEAVELASNETIVVRAREQALARTSGNSSRTQSGQDTFDAVSLASQGVHLLNEAELTFATEPAFTPENWSITNPELTELSGKQLTIKGAFGGNTVLSKLVLIDAGMKMRMACSADVDGYLMVNVRNEANGKWRGVFARVHGENGKIRIGGHDNDAFRTRETKEIEFEPQESFLVSYKADNGAVLMSVNNKRTSFIGYGLGKIGNEGRIGFIVHRGRISVGDLIVTAESAAR